MKKIQATFTFCLLLSSGLMAKKPVLRVDTIKIVSNDTLPEHNLNDSARLSGCKEALYNYTQLLKKLSESPVGNSEHTLICLLIADAKQMQETITPTSPEMGERFGTLIFLAEKLCTKN